MHMCAALLSVIEGFGAVMSFSLWKGFVTPFFSFSYPSPFFKHWGWCGIYMSCNAYGPEIGQYQTVVHGNQKIIISFHSPRWDCTTLNIIDAKNVLEDITQKITQHLH